MIAREYQILEQLRKLDDEEQQRVLDFIEALKSPFAINGDEIIARAHRVDFASDDLAEMQRAIDESCERIEAEADNRDLFA